MNETYEWRGFKIKLSQDSDCENPQDLKNDPDGPVITYNESARTILGNKPVSQKEFLRTGEKIARGEYIGLPVYAYVHGGIALRHFPFRDIDPQGFDSGQSGFIYVVASNVRKDQGVARITKELRESTLKSLRAELKEFERWLNGECYVYEIEDEDGHVIETVGGYIGRAYAEEQARDAIDREITRRTMGDEDEDDSSRDDAQPDYKLPRDDLPAALGSHEDLPVPSGTAHTVTEWWDPNWNER
jgi:hypothetical protein